MILLPGRILAGSKYVILRPGAGSAQPQCAGANIDSTNEAGQTALRVAEGHLICCTTYVRHTEAAERLREFGADPELGIQLTFGLTAFGDQADPNEAR